MILKWDRLAIITRNTDSSSSDGSGSDFEFDEGIGTDTGTETILTDYPCKINETVNYDTSNQGESYKGSAIMKGRLTNKLQKGDIIDGLYKIITKPKIIHCRYIQCQLVKLG